jgi:hypothetical protein
MGWKTRPGRTPETPAESFNRPSATNSRVLAFPPLKRQAIFIRPFGTRCAKASLRRDEMRRLIPPPHVMRGLKVRLSALGIPAATFSESMQASVEGRASPPAGSYEKPQAPPNAESRTPNAESREPKAESRKPKAESRKPKAESRKPKAESRKPKAESQSPSPSPR